MIGYYIGTLSSAVLTGSFFQSFSDINHFNFSLVAMALGGVFLIPSPRSYLLSFIAVMTTTIVLSAVKTFWAFYGIPAFTFPFNFISLTFLYVLGLIGFPVVARYIGKTPEETLDYYLTIQKRFKGTERTLHLPFAGEWTVWQGFDDEWTHKGSWKYAYDFVITDAEGKTHTSNGLELTDYYAYRKPVLSPVRGRVVKVVSNLPDNPIGTVDNKNNWGNYVIIYDPRGFYVELSHFAQNSIRVKEGDWVEVGSFIGLCGNSGYSPQPHIHIQVQVSEDIGSPTLPFSFVSYISGNTFHSNDLPEKGKVVKPVYADKSLSNRLSFYLENEFVYEVFENDEKIDEISMKVRMAPDGTFFFDTGKGKLFFGKDEGTFYFYRLDGKDKYLKLLFMSAPRIPLTDKENIIWYDYLPFSVVFRGYIKDVILLLSSFSHSFSLTKYTGTFQDKKRITGEIRSHLLREPIYTELVLNDVLGFEHIKVGKVSLKLKKTLFGG